MSRRGRVRCTDSTSSAHWMTTASVGGLRRDVVGVDLERCRLAALFLQGVLVGVGLLRRLALGGLFGWVRLAVAHAPDGTPGFLNSRKLGARDAW